MYWAIFGIFHSLFRAFFAEINRVYKVDGWQLSFWHASVAVLVLLPFTPFMDWPADVNFYLAAFLVAMILSVGVIIQLNLSSMNKGRIAGISIPFEATFAALIWIAVNEYMIDYYAQNMVMTVGVMSAFALVIAALFFLRRSDMTWPVFLVVAPVAVTYAVAGVVTKMVIPVNQLVPAALSFVLVNYIVMTIVIGVVLLLKGRANAGLVAVPMMKAGTMTGVFSAMAYLTFVVSVVFAPNPGYTSLLAALVPVWLMWYHELRLEKDTAKPLAGLLVAAGVVLLIIATWV
ncbi:MAG: hypothetical protein CO093_02960 [Alphaproteobacteria bacterium CG_4_9_14_3_um_filter_47_13]|nr:MAG: hypothetical protein CO093_02960 [Alphaproteobacteria bacterium CG_4_9_14_3_um_filter_47_13]